MIKVKLCGNEVERLRVSAAAFKQLTADRLSTFKQLTAARLSTFALKKKKVDSLAVCQADNICVKEKEDK